MIVSKTLASLFMVAFSGVVCVAHALTNMVIANNSGDIIYLNGSTPLGHARATWVPLNLRVDVPHQDLYLQIIDTHRQCRSGGWQIRLQHEQHGHVQYGEKCLNLSFGETGCIALRIDHDQVAWRRVRWTHCSDQWWRQNRDDAWRVFEIIASLAGSRGTIPLPLAPAPMMTPEPPPAPYPESPAQRYQRSPASDVEVGPIWNNEDALDKCERAARHLGGTWNGHWRTTIPGRMSVCAIHFN